MCSLAVSPLYLTTVEQRFLRGPSLWSGNSCLVTVLDMGPLARALTTDFPGLDQRLLALFPALHAYAEPMRRGAFIAEMLGHIALALQPPDGVRGRHALTVHGKQSRVRIVITARCEHLAVQALAQAAALLAALCAGARAIVPSLSGRKDLADTCRGAAPPFLHLAPSPAGLSASA